MTSRDYDEKIYKLFKEGKKLGAQGIMEVNSITADNPKSISNASSPRMDMIALEQEFDKQAKEADRLQRELNTARNNIQKTGQEISDGLHPSVFSNLKLQQFQNTPPPLLQSNLSNNNSTSFSLFQPNEVSGLTNAKRHLENALEDSQAQVEYLTNKLDNMKRSMDEQKDRFRFAIEELQGKLHETVAGRKKLIELRQRDMRDQEETIQRLRATLKELAASNQMQEQALLDAHERMEILENRNQSNENAMTKIRSALSSALSKTASRSKNPSYTNSEHIAELVPEVLVDNFERFVANSNEEADQLRSKLLQLEAELNATKQSHEADRLLASSDAAEVVSSLKNDYQKEIEREKSRCKEAEDSLNLMTSKMKELQADNTAQVRLVAQSRDQISDLTRQLNELRQVHCSEKGELQSRIVCLEYDVKLAADRDERLKEENDSQKQSIADLTNRLGQVSSELNSERELRLDLSAKESELHKNIHDLRRQVDEKNVEVSRLREMIAQLRGDLTTKVAREINEAENAQRLKADERIASVTQENIGLREDLSRAKASFEAAERQLSDVIAERSQAMQMVKEKDKQVDRLSSQLSLSDRKLIEATEARKSSDERIRTLQSEYNSANKSANQYNNDIERLKSIVEDKERAALQLRHQLDSKTELLKTANKQMADTSSENKHLKSLNKEQQNTIEDLTSSLKMKEDRLLDYEKRMGELVEEKEKIVADVRGIETQIVALVEDKKLADTEMKETRIQLSRLIEERDELTKELRSAEDVYKENIERLKRELKQKKFDLQLFQESVQSVKHIDGKAAKIAADMQKQVTDKRGIIDSLQTELANVYDKLESEHRENKRNKKENTKLQHRMHDLDEKLRRSEEDLRSRTKSEKSFKLAVERLEAALEKAAERNAAAQSVIDRQEAELSKAHIRRNLELMDKRIPSALHVLAEEKMPYSNGMTTAHGRLALPMSTNYTVLQNMLAQILATKSNDHTMQMPVKHNAASGRKSEVPSNMSTEEIYKILTEVREQLAQNGKHMKMTSDDLSDRIKRYKKGNKHKHGPVANKSSEIPAVFAHSDVTSNNSVSFSNLSDSNDVTLPVLPSHDFLRTSSPYRARESVDVKKVNPSSPVSMLLAGGEGIHNSFLNKSLTSTLSPIKHHGGSMNDRIVAGYAREKSDERDRFVGEAISDNAEELCRQLQDRLEGLSRIGGKLEKQNRMAAKLMKKQDEKLKRVRENGEMLR